jgi:nondiscriminating aspartyl-tRNA synthetase
MELAGKAGERVMIAGWLHAIRRLAKVTFVVVRDGWGTAQAVMGPGALDGVELESIVEIEGTVVVHPQVELHDVDARVIETASPAPVVLSKKQLDVPLPAMLDHAAVANRHPTRRAVFRIAAAGMRGFRSALDDKGFVEIQSPKLVETATEGGANVFEVKYFGRSAYLAQSPQLYKQIMVGVFERVYEVGPVFRAEPHDTSRHINQYTSLDVELGFIRDQRDVMAVARDAVASMVTEVARSCANELAVLEARLPAVPAVIPSLHFADAREMIASAIGESERDQPDLSPEGERWLGRWAMEQHASEWLFVTGYPMAKRPFYTHPDRERPAFSSSFDLLFRGTELVTGGQRLHRHADYVAALDARGMSPAPIAAYLDVFAHGMPPHGGFAIGLERFVMQLLGLPNIRQAVLFPRDMSRLSP